MSRITRFLRPGTRSRGRRWADFGVDTVSRTALQANNIERRALLGRRPPRLESWRLRASSSFGSIYAVQQGVSLRHPAFVRPRPTLEVVDRRSDWVMTNCSDSQQHSTLATERSRALDRRRFPAHPRIWRRAVTASDLLDAICRIFRLVDIYPKPTCDRQEGSNRLYTNTIRHALTARTTRCAGNGFRQPTLITFRFKSRILVAPYLGFMRVNL